MSDPFAVLSLDRTATKRDILAHVAAAEFEHTLDACGGFADVLPEPVKDGPRPALKLLR